MRDVTKTWSSVATDSETNDRRTCTSQIYNCRSRWKRAERTLETCLSMVIDLRTLSLQALERRCLERRQCLLRVVSWSPTVTERTTTTHKSSPQQLSVKITQTFTNFECLTSSHGASRKFYRKFHLYQWHRQYFWLDKTGTKSSEGSEEQIFCSFCVFFRDI